SDLKADKGDRTGGGVGIEKPNPNPVIEGVIRDSELSGRVQELSQTWHASESQIGVVSKVRRPGDRAAGFACRGETTGEIGGAIAKSIAVLSIPQGGPARDRCRARAVEG